MFKKPYFSLLFWAVLVFTPAAAQAQQPDEATLSTWIQKGLEYYDNEDYEEAVYWLRKAANQGHATAQALLGAMYYEGAGVVKNYEEAVYWLREAANQGHEKAKKALAMLEEKESPTP